MKTPRRLSVVAFIMPVSKSYALTNIGNRFYTACHFLPSEVFMEE